MLQRSLALIAACAPALSATEAPIAANVAEVASVRLITLDPGHFHAALMQKHMYAGVDPVVHVYAPAGDDVAQHLKRVESYNTRAEQPTHWREQVYTGPDYLEKMLADNAGNVVVISGNNARKTEYIARAVEAGMHVMADKPMAITPADYERLKAAFATAESKGVLLTDIMTERHEITTILQRELSRQPALFGMLVPGTPDDPAITKESVHHFSKLVSGAPLRRPQWFFDVRQQGEGIVDISNHLVDLVQWEAFPEQVLQPLDVTMLQARRWSTPLTREQFGRVTGATDFPEYLRDEVRDGVLNVYSNGEFTYRLRGVHARVSVRWDFEAPPGAGDTHFSVMRGTLANLVIRQGAEQTFKPVLYVENASPASATEFETNLATAIARLQDRFPGVGWRRDGESWVVTVPAKYDVGHEAHFAQVAEDYLRYLRAGRLPDWEVPGMLTKLHTIMQAYQLSRPGGSWRRDATSLTRYDSGQPLWSFSFDARAGKPHFHPLATAGGPALTAAQPSDHPWHYGLWLSWKFVNGANYWEEDRKTGRPEGVTRWNMRSVDPRPEGSATLRLDLEYVHPSGGIDLTEARTLEISAPDADGGYAIDWRSQFTAGVRGAVLDRTAMPHEPNGKVNGGYAGLGLRVAGEPLALAFVSSHGPVTDFASNRARPAAPALAANLSLGDRDVGGIAIASDPANAGVDAPWYIVVDPSSGMRFISAAVLAPKVLTLAPGATLALRYRIVVRRSAWTAEALRTLQD